MSSSDGQVETEHFKDFVDVFLDMTTENNYIKEYGKSTWETIKEIMFVCR